MLTEYDILLKEPYKKVLLYKPPENDKEDF